MTNLTAQNVLATIKNDKRIDQNVEFDEPNKAIIHLEDGWTWNALDGNRSVEGFILSGNDWDKPDTLGYFKRRIKFIEPII
jgi:hypothetical protein